MNKEIVLGSVPDGAEPFIIAENFINTKNSIFYIAKDDREIYKINDKLKWLLPNIEILIYRSWDQIPYDNVSPSKEIQSERIKCLFQLTKEKKRIILTSVNAIIQKTVNNEFIESNFIEIFTGKKFNFNNLINRLNSLGYDRTSVVRDKAEFSIRGSIIDIFIADINHPIRIDFFADTIESIYTFDPINQKRIKKLKKEKILIYSSSEILLSQSSIDLFKKNFRNFFSDYRLSHVYHSFNEGVMPPGGEQFLPFFLDKMQSVFSFSNNFEIILNKDFYPLLDIRLENINDFYKARKDLKENFYLEPSNLYFSKDSLLNCIKKYKLIKLEDFKNKNNIDNKIKLIPNLSSIKKEIDFKFIKKYLTIKSDIKKIIICCKSLGSLERVKNILIENMYIDPLQINEFKEILIELNIYITILDLENSLELDKFIFINEKSLFGYNISTSKRKNKNTEIFFEEINKLTRGCILVHADYGLCKFNNIVKINVDKSMHDCVELEFSDNQKLFLPVENLNYVTKYSDEIENNIQLDRLGSAHWQKRKAEAKKRIKESAKKLIAIAAKRSQSQSYQIDFDQSEYDKFSSTFPFIETDDQLNAIDDVILDFKKNIPADRLIVGDVAFGKTEVIIRAIYLASKSQLQSIILVPTTLLSKQHYENFTKRFSPFGITVSQISRFVSEKNKLEIYEQIKEGSIQIIVGTHALLNDKIKFNKLGLIIYDEEQKFGTKQKEKLKEIAPSAHVISLSATPIPRTLSMSLSGIRDLSLILTAPYERLSVRTFISPFDKFTIIESIKREVLGRKNGVFFVTPRKKDIPFLEKFMNENLPEIKYVVAHGQLSSKILEERISKFYNRIVPLMISTNIVENGLDLPHVNTIIIYRSNMFSLSAIYQLKGRVGRSSKRGYAYLTFNEKEMTENGRRRLNVINSFEKLGSGFNIASHDLDMRGGGSIIGEEQSGFIREIGTELYHQMLEQEILKQKKNLSGSQNFENNFLFQPIIKIPEEIFIPDFYIDDLDLRMSIYKRISSINKIHQCKEIISEIIDRFGKLPIQVENLFKVIEIKIICLDNSIDFIEFNRKGIVFGFFRNIPPDPDKIMSFGFDSKKQISIRSDQKIFYNFFGELNEDRFDLIKKLIKKLT